MSETIGDFWQPHWTSCLRVKGYLSVRGIEYQSINVMAAEGGRRSCAGWGRARCRSSRAVTASC